MDFIYICEFLKANHSTLTRLACSISANSWICAARSALAAAYWSSSWRDVYKRQQLAVLDLLALWFARVLGTVAPEEYHTILDEMTRLPDKMERVLAERDSIQYLSLIHI